MASINRADYERHLSTLGSWAELLPPWEIVERAMSESEIIISEEFFEHEELISSKKLRELLDRVTELQHELKREQENGLIQFAHYRKQYAAVVAIARALLAETGLTPSEVRSRWPEDAEWLLT